MEFGRPSRKPGPQSVASYHHRVVSAAGVAYDVTDLELKFTLKMKT